MVKKKDNFKSWCQDRDTVGKIASDLMQKEADDATALELSRGMTKDYMDNLFDVIADGKNAYDEDFFVVVLTKRERVLANVVRNFFFYRKSCPTPNYDQAVYSYTKNDDCVDLVWVVPDRQSSFRMRHNALSIPADQRELLNNVLDFFDGTLARRAKELNNEDVLGSDLILFPIDEGN